MQFLVRRLPPSVTKHTTDKPKITISCMFLAPVSSNSTHYYGDPGWLQPDKSVAESNIETQHNFMPIKFWQKHQFYCKILLKMTWLCEIGKIYWDSVENLRENMNLGSKFCVCVSILDAATDLSGCRHSGSL